MVLFCKISSYKLFFLGLCISQFFQPLNSTFSDFEGSLIALQVDTLSWPQVGLLKTMFLILFKMWIHGVLPFEVELPLNQLVKESRDQRGMLMDIINCHYYFKDLSYTLSSRNLSHIFPHATMGKWNPAMLADYRWLVVRETQVHKKMEEGQEEITVGQIYCHNYFHDLSNLNNVLNVLISQKQCDRNKRHAWIQLS